MNKQYIENLEYLFKQYEFQNALDFFENNSKFISNNEYDLLRHKYIKLYREKLIQKAELTKDELRKFSYSAPEELFDLTDFLYDITSELSDYNFKYADELFQNENQGILDYEQYVSIKASYVIKYFNKVLPEVKIDSEKAYSIADFSQYQLLDARAGSGKTTTICLRTKLLIEKYGLKPSEILILAFNNSVPQKINDDFKNKYNLDFKNVMTFHKFAESLIKDRVNKNTIEEFIRNSINKVLSDGETYNKLYEFYKYPLLLEDTFQPNMSPEDFYNLRKNMRLETLRGESVDSRGEKYIADYLFEHDIEYKCQPRIMLKDEERANFGLKCRIYCPDFRIKIDNQVFYWEHWALTSLDELDNNNPIKDPENYIRFIKIKRDFWKKRKYELIETKSADSKNQEFFENKIDELFKDKLGYTPKKLSHKEIIEKIKKYHKKTKIENCYENFIKKIDNHLINTDELRQKAGECLPNLSNFINIGLKIYNEYTEAKKTSSLLDFNDTIKGAVAKINNNYNYCIYNEDKYELKDVKYIMIDEYQDFSPLLYKLIESIKRKNSAVNIFCVGDNLQCIYSFAGANKKYFENFEKFFDQNSSIRSLSMNYRSKYELVHFANQLAQGKCRTLSQADRNNTGGEIYEIKVDETFVDLDSIYEIENDELDKILAKYLKTCQFIINSNPNKDILILSRTNFLYKNAIKEIFKNLEYKNKDTNKFIKTIHKAKGLEADIVIILNVNEGVIPMIDSMSEIEYVFGNSVADILDEELRLFYVGLTRAKEKIYLLSESYRSSELVQSLGPKQTYIFENNLVRYNKFYRKSTDNMEWQEAKKAKFEIESEFSNDIE